MPGTGRLPGPLIPKIPRGSFRLLTTPVYKVTPPPGAAPASSSPAPSPQPSLPGENDDNQDNGDEKPGWRFNPIDPAAVARRAVQDTLDRKINLLPRDPVKPAQDTPPQPANDEPNDDPQWILQTGEQSTHHWRFPNASGYGPVVEHAAAISAARNWPLHAKGKSGLEFQLGLTLLYDLYYLNDRRLGEEAHRDHSLKHSPTNLQLQAQLAYLWPFFLSADKESILDVSVLGQVVPALNWAYDYEAHGTTVAKQLQVVLGASVTIKPFAHEKKGDKFFFLKEFFITAGPQVGATLLSDPNTVDLSGTISIGRQF